MYLNDIKSIYLKRRPFKVGVTDNLINYISVLHFMYLNVISDMEMSKSTGEVTYCDFGCEVIKNFHDQVKMALTPEQDVAISVLDALEHDEE